MKNFLFPCSSLVSLVTGSGRYLVTCIHCMCSILYLVLFAASCRSACVRGCLSTEESVEDSAAQIVTVQLYYYYIQCHLALLATIQYTIHCAFCTFKMHQI